MPACRNALWLLLFIGCLALARSAAQAQSAAGEDEISTSQTTDSDDSEVREMADLVKVIAQLKTQRQGRSGQQSTNQDTDASQLDDQQGSSGEDAATYAKEEESSDANTAEQDERSTAELNSYREQHTDDHQQHEPYADDQEVISYGECPVGQPADAVGNRWALGGAATCKLTHRQSLLLLWWCLCVVC